MKDNVRGTGRTTRMLKEVLRHVATSIDPDARQVNIFVYFHSVACTREMFIYKFGEMLHSIGFLDRGKISLVRNCFEIENVRVFFKTTTKPIDIHVPTRKLAEKHPYLLGVQPPVYIFEDHYIYDVQNFKKHT